MPKMKNKIEKETYSTLVYRAMKEMIAHRRFTPGQRLNVEELSKELGVSRTPVWEAVRRLEQDGLVENIPNRGVFMAELSPPEMIHLCRVREVLEGFAGRLAAGRMDEKVLKKMDDCLDSIWKAAERGDSAGYARYDADFHALIHDACGNPFLKEILRVIENKLQSLVPTPEPLPLRGCKGHREIYEALRSGKPAQAESVLRQHYKATPLPTQKACPPTDFRSNLVHCKGDFSFDDFSRA
ncbi:MAG: GntR family transcriptional regulator [Desulfobacteraceae bacterium]|nr:MAG: GntR family transcriptional regulator [Desulfobacteraceae bacterium]